MNKKELSEKLVALEAKFNELQEQRNNASEELLRLQGEHRALSLLVEELETPDVKVKGE